MSLFRRSHKNSLAVPLPRGGAQELTCNTTESLKNVLLQSTHPSKHASSPHSTALSSSALITAGVAALAGIAYCASRTPRIPDGIHPVEHFDLDRYLGQWYEVAHIDQGIDKGLLRIQVEYSRLSSGCILTTHRGYAPLCNEWRVSHGKARPTIAPDIAAFKVSFFGPFYRGYNVVALGCVEI